MSSMSTDASDYLIYLISPLLRLRPAPLTLEDITKLDISRRSIIPSSTPAAVSLWPGS
jgi:hypothetical protein